MHARLTAVFDALGVDFEIIFVNDGSPDDADQVLRDLTARDPHVLAVEHSRNFGSQSAFVSGMQLARGDAVILLDGDLQDPPELIAEFHARWKEGYAVVYGRRGRREGSALLALACRAFYRLFRGLSDVAMPLDAGDFSLMDRRVVDELLALPERDQFLRGLRAWVGFKQTGVDYLRPVRAFGRSTHSWWANVWWAKKGIFAFSFAPLEVLGYGAAALTAASGIALAVFTLRAWCRPAPASLAPILVSLVVFFGALNLLAVALLGEYLAKVVQETKARPRFIRKAIRHAGRIFEKREEIEGFVRGRQERPGHEG